MIGEPLEERCPVPRPPPPIAPRGIARRVSRRPHGNVRLDPSADRFQEESSPVSRIGGTRGVGLVSREGCGRSPHTMKRSEKLFAEARRVDSRRRQQSGARVEERRRNAAVSIARAGRTRHRCRRTKLRGPGLLVGTTDLRACTPERRPRRSGRGRSRRVVRRTDARRSRARARDRRRLPVDREGSPRQLGHRSDDVRDPSRARLHEASRACSSFPGAITATSTRLLVRAGSGGATFGTPGQRWCARRPSRRSHASPSSTTLGEVEACLAITRTRDCGRDRRASRRKHGRRAAEAGVPRRRCASSRADPAPC